MTEHIKRFGEYIIDLEKQPENTEMIKNARLFKEPQLRLRMQFEQGFKGRFIISDLVIDQAR